MSDFVRTVREPNCSTPGSEQEDCGWDDSEDDVFKKDREVEAPEWAGVSRPKLGVGGGVMVCHGLCVGKEGRDAMGS